MGRPETRQEGGGSGEQAAMEVGEPPEGGGPRQYRRAEVDGCRGGGGGGGGGRLQRGCS